jgi:protein-S-isoprenylcysteine O-methyltransferase Ste14
MNMYRSLIGACWLVLVVFWTVTAIGAKQNIGRPQLRKGIAVRLAIIVLIVLAFRLPPLRQLLLNVQRHIAGNAIAGVLGVVLCALGIAFAIWARVHLGKNWGMPMSQKANAELVMTGPYARVRHPIYSGILLAMLGSTIGASVFWLLPLLLFASYFVYSARREEELMVSLFPEDYGAYMKRSNMLLPWPTVSKRNGS